MKKLYRTFWVARGFFPETEGTVEVESIAVHPADNEWPNMAYGYYFWEVTEIVTEEGETLRGKSKGVGPTYYRGKLHTREQCIEGNKTDPKKFTSILLTNMDYNSDYYDAVVECYQGMVPFNTRKPEEYQFIPA